MKSPTSLINPFHFPMSIRSALYCLVKERVTALSITGRETWVMCNLSRADAVGIYDGMVRLAAGIDVENNAKAMCRGYFGIERIVG